MTYLAGATKSSKAQKSPAITAYNSLICSEKPREGSLEQDRGIDGTPENVRRACDRSLHRLAWTMLIFTTSIASTSRCRIEETGCRSPLIMLRRPPNASYSNVVVCDKKVGLRGHYLLGILIAVLVKLSPIRWNLLPAIALEATIRSMVVA